MFSNGICFLIINILIFLFLNSYCFFFKNHMNIFIILKKFKNLIFLLIKKIKNPYNSYGLALWIFTIIYNSYGLTNS